MNYVNLFDRKLTRRSRQIDDSDTIYYDNNMVLSVDASFDSKKVLPDLPVTFGFNGEFAMSKWSVNRDYLKKERVRSYKLASGDVNGKSVIYLQEYYKLATSLLVNEDYRDEDGKSIYADVFVKGDIQDVDFKVNAGYLQTDSNFWSELASSPVYQGRSTILNANALYAEGSYESMIMSTFGASSLENLYFNVYNSTTLQATNLMTSNSSNTLSDDDESKYLYSLVWTFGQQLQERPLLPQWLHGQYCKETRT